MLDVHLQILSSVETSVTSPPRPSSPSTSHARGLFSPNWSDTGTPEPNPFSPGTASDDAISLSSPSSLVKKQSYSMFQTPDTWRPSIMQCLRKETDEQRLLELDTSRRNEIVRDLVTQMFAMDPKPNSTFTSLVAKKTSKEVSFHERHWFKGVWICKFLYSLFFFTFSPL